MLQDPNRPGCRRFVIDDVGLTVLGGSITVLGGSIPVPQSQAALVTISYNVVGAIPFDGSPLSVVEILVNGTDPTDTDLFTTVLTIDLRPRQVNKVSDLKIVRGFDGANFTYLTIEGGVDDNVQVWPVGVDPEQNPEQVIEGRNAILSDLSDPDRAIAIFDALRDAGVRRDDSEAEILAAIEAAGIEIPSTSFQDAADLAAFLADLEKLRAIKLQPFFHSVTVSGLASETQYAFLITAQSFDGNLALRRGEYETRKFPDVTEMKISKLSHDSIVSPTNDRAVVIVRWFTNRPGNTILEVQGPNAPADPFQADDNGTLAHIAVIEDLDPKQVYTFTARSVFVGELADRLIDADLMTLEEATNEVTGDFRTARLRPIPRPKGFVGRPFVNASTESIELVVRFNLPLNVWVEHSVVTDPSTKIAQLGDDLYTTRVTSDDPLTRTQHHPSRPGAG